MPTQQLTLGNQLPDFEAYDQDGNCIKSSDFDGYPLVLFFYPHDSSLEGIKILELYNEYLAEFEDLEAIVIGVSPDDASCHKRLMHTHHLSIPLIVDQKMGLARKFSTTIEDKSTKKTKVEISTFVIDQDGTVCWSEKPAKIDNHLDRVIQALDDFCG